MVASDERWVTAEKLYERFNDAISARRPHPDIGLCDELATNINQYRPSFDYQMAARRSDFVVRARKDQARVAKDARRLLSSLRRLPVHWEPNNEDDGEDILTMVAKIVEVFGSRRVQIKETKADLWVSCAKMFTPHIVDTLRKAGWKRISSTSPEGPVIAVLSLLIGAVTGEEPDWGSLSSTLKSRAAGDKTRRKTSLKTFHDRSREHA